MDKNRQGIIAAQSGDLNKAQRLFMEAFAETPNNEGLFLNVARSMSMQRKHQELLSYFDCEFTEKGRQLNEPNCAIILAQSAIEEGMEGKAIAILEAIQEKTDNITIAIMLSEQLIKTSQLEKCQSVLTKILRKTTNEDPSLITNLAITESELGNYKTAEELYKKVIKIRPNEFLGYFNIANFMHEIGNIDSAKAYLTRAETIVANTPEARKLRNAIADSQGEESTRMGKIYRLIENEKWDDAKDIDHFKGKYFEGRRNRFGLYDVSWHGTKLNSPGWDDPNALCLGMTLGDTAEDTDQTGNIHVMFNMYWDGVEFEIPQASGLRWYRAIDTALPTPNDIQPPEQQVAIDGSTYLVTGRSIVVLASRETN